jgi:hypothetical protein
VFTLRPGDGVLRVLELGFGEVFESLLIKIDGFRWMDRLGAEMMGNVRGATFLFISWPLFETFSLARAVSSSSSLSSSSRSRARSFVAVGGAEDCLYAGHLNV